MKLFKFLPLLILLVWAGCSDDQEKPKNKVEFSIDVIELEERKTQRIEFSFTRNTKATDTLVVTVTNNSTANSDYEFSENLENNQFVITAEEPYFDITASYDAVPETDETLQLEITAVDKGYKIGEQSVLTITIKNYGISDNLVGEYLFDGNAEDTSPGNSNDGAVSGPGLTTDRMGNANSAYTFDGVNDYISIDDNSATDFNSSQNYSISLWVDAAVQVDLSSTINYIVRKWAGDAQAYPFGISFLNHLHAQHPNELYLERYDGQACGNVSQNFSGEIQLNGFKHLVMVRNGNTVSQYVNGIKVSEASSPLVCPTSNNTPITIGTNAFFIRFFKGKIDDIRFYDTALTQEQVTELFEEVPEN